MVGIFEVEMRTRGKMKMWVPIEIGGMRVLTTIVIKTMERKEEDECEGIGKDYQLPKTHGHKLSPLLITQKVH